MFDGKDFFTIYDYVDAYHNFSDPEWDGEPLEPEETEGTMAGEPPIVYPPLNPPVDGEPPTGRQKIKIKLSDGKEREIQHMIATSFWSADGKPISAEEFMQNLFGTLPEFFKNEEELRTIWGNPITRKQFLEKLEEAGFGKDELAVLQKLVNGENSDLYDVLEYVFNSKYKLISREQRVANSQHNIFALLNTNEKEFLEFVLLKYIECGVEELNRKNFPTC